MIHPKLSFQSNDTGELKEFGDPEGVAWLFFLFNNQNIQFVPMSVTELVAQKGGVLVVGDLFTVNLDMRAQRQGDVNPQLISFDGHWPEGE